MSPQRASALTAPQRLPAELPDRLRSCRTEIEDSLLARMRSVADPSEVGDADYVHGLREAVCVALDHAIEILDRPASAEQPLPPQLAAQARLAARRGVRLEIVIRRYVAGHSLLCGYLLREAGETSARWLEGALRAEAVLLDRVIDEISEAYGQELNHGHRTAEQRRAELVRRLLAGEQDSASQLGYDLELWHLGIVAAGPGAEPLLRKLAADFDRRLLLVHAGGEETWAWLGGQRRLTTGELTERVKQAQRRELNLAIGEPGRSPSGWRLTHRQAKLALPIARREEEGVVSYSDVALLTTVLQDDVFAATLRDLYLVPLEGDRDGGALRETLRAYIAAGYNVSSAAAALGVSRTTVTKRLHRVEGRLRRPVSSCMAEIGIALQLDEVAEGYGQHDNFSPTSRITLETSAQL